MRCHWCSSVCYAGGAVVRLLQAIECCGGIMCACPLAFPADDGSNMRKARGDVVAEQPYKHIIEMR